MICIDDLNDWVGCLGGHEQVKTPHIDALAARGTLFTNAHCQAPLCNPSRTSIFTGLRPSTTGVYGLSPWLREVATLKDHETLTQYFARHGYRTLTAGKVHHYREDRTRAEFARHGPPVSIGRGPGQLLVKTPSRHPLVDWGTFPHRDEEKGDWRVASWAVERLSEARRDDEQPFFFTVGFFLPHVPLYATQEWFDLYPTSNLQLPKVRRDDRDDTPRFSWYLHWKLPEPRLRFLEEEDQWKNLVRSYLACVSFMDSQVGRVLAALEENELADNTVVVLWSDHGFHLGEKLITGKNSLWEESTQVPLIFAGPQVAKTARCGEPAELLDLYPTLVKLCGLPAREGLEGHSLMPQLRDAQTARPWPAITTHNHDNHSVRSRDWRYIRYADGSEELYDHRRDANEWQNLAADPQYQADLARHRAHLPKRNARPVPGSGGRVLTYEAGVVTWEGERVEADAAIPEL
ncbi:MAG: DUF229 domain-containing protein [Planctomycetota bacterium]|nr:MAG: DUF229 domain-containing protein [Planctomycetota bacterium]REJ93542.1 MAG: DUF229 domain-containing protein [Planctomycetota bacterium]REK24708.1 MAG: DUF229 domain-containing protein [Planctomycetota bacterium]REK40206.1 MAG: DUF229 domain-containing protein [Planctomycetota bacterium]